MTIYKLFQLGDDEQLTPADCAEINIYLSGVDIENIPEVQRKNVEDYLVRALNINSVEHKLTSQLDRLVKQLQSTHLS